MTPTWDASAGRVVNAHCQSLAAAARPGGRELAHLLVDGKEPEIGGGQGKVDGGGAVDSSSTNFA
jgi:hypothetical protein